MNDGVRPKGWPKDWDAGFYAEQRFGYPANPHVPERCNGCGRWLLLENLYVDDGCPCNTPRGVNFKPQPCALCGTDNCVKPGHRLDELFGLRGASGNAP